ncbi:hypothetical protein NM688_g6362 [Phlebia brevispora]|uniref:Uncharacterized protein n=1 Tax=Phlebia brevispora TaxID=194682 RepID=A0ACC1SGX7_9APHY|nr:hypothetical protein NM688_g6362 [Phlebia brevispora]
MPLPARTHLFLVVVLLLSYTLPTLAILGHKWEATNFCKCICFGTNYTILQMAIPDNPNKPCAQIGDADPDTATGKEGDVEARCFQRDSPRDQLVVTLFLLTVFGLLLGAGVKNRMVKAGFDTSLAWNRGRRWWEAWVPQRLPDNIALGERFFGRSRDHDSAGTYESVPNSPAP